MEVLLTQYSKYKAYVKESEQLIEEKESSYKPTFGIELEEMSSLKTADLYAESIGALRVGNLYILNTGQRIRYFKFIESISYRFFCTNKSKKVSIIKNSSVFTIENFNEVIDNFKYNLNLSKEIKTIKSKVTLAKNKISEIKNTFFTGIKEEISSSLFENVSDFIDFSSECASKQFLLSDYEPFFNDTYDQFCVKSRPFEVIYGFNIHNRSMAFSMKNDLNSFVNFLFQDSNTELFLKRKLFCHYTHTIVSNHIEELID
jgi:hypothetical protein